MTTRDGVLRAQAWSHDSENDHGRIDIEIPRAMLLEQGRIQEVVGIE